jgi:hypothetical protein
MLRVGRLSQSSQDAGPLAHRLFRLRFAARGQVPVQVRRVISPEWSHCANEAALSFSLTTPQIETSQQSRSSGPLDRPRVGNEAPHPGRLARGSARALSHHRDAPRGQGRKQRARAETIAPRRHGDAKNHKWGGGGWGRGYGPISPCLALASCDRRGEMRSGAIGAEGKASRRGGLSLPTKSGAPG